MMCVVYYDITVFVLALNRISSVCASESIECISDRFQGSTVKICCSSCIKCICYVVASGDLKTYPGLLFTVYNDVE